MTNKTLATSTIESTVQQHHCFLKSTGFVDPIAGHKDAVEIQKTDF